MEAHAIEALLGVALFGILVVWHRRRASQAIVVTDRGWQGLGSAPPSMLAERAPSLGVRPTMRGRLMTCCTAGEVGGTVTIDDGSLHFQPGRFGRAAGVRDIRLNWAEVQRVEFQPSPLPLGDPVIRLFLSSGEVAFFGARPEPDALRALQRVPALAGRVEIRPLRRK